MDGLVMTMSGALTWFIGVPLKIVIIIVVAIIAEFILLWLINRGVKRAVERPLTLRMTRQAVALPGDLSEQELTTRTTQRAEAIGSLLRSVVTIAIWVITALTVLPLLGINIAPLVASAGIVGIALGFGAQSLVKDYIAGILLILEDQYGIGDDVEVGEVTGTVEFVSLRYTRLRDAEGVIWYLRNGDIQTVGNKSQGSASAS
jgi:small conductance mechanosensitive channel